MLERLFKLKERKTDLKTEFLAGFTTFLTMMYIVPVNGFIMADAGLPMDAVITATALITILATAFNGIWSNTPIAMSVGMGLNAYFTYGLVLGMKIPWQSALGIVFISGVIFLLLSFTKFRVWIINSIPMDLRRAISAGIGAFIAFIGLKEMHIIVDSKATFVTLGTLSDPNVMLGVFSLFVVLILYSYRIKGSFILAVIISSIVAYITGIAKVPTEFFSMPASIEPIAFKLDIMSALSLSLLPVIVTFLITDMFDTLGTLTAVGARANLFQGGEDKDKALEKTLEADAAATVTGSLLGVSTTTSFIESASGVEAGGRTGLTAIFTALFFISTLFMLPLFKAIPEPAILPILVAVGVLMFMELGKLNFANMDIATASASFFAILLMPLTYSITNGLAAAFITYTVVKIAQRKWSDLNLGVLIIALISLIVFIVHG